MKKITFILCIMIGFLGWSQELVINGDFETGDTAGWTGNAANVVAQGSNYVNEANVTMAGDPWNVNLSQVLSLTAGTTYTFSFEAWTDATTGTRTIIAGIGLNEAPWTAVTEIVNLTDAPQTFTYTMVAPVTSTNNRVLFDMGAATGFVFLDNVSLMEVTATCSDGIQNGSETGVDCGGPDCPPCAATCSDGIMNGSETGVDCGGPDCPPCAAAPSTAAPTPPNRAEADVMSIFSDAYNDIPVGTWGPDWGPASSRIFDFMAGGNPAKLMDVESGQVFAGIDFASNAFDASTFTHFHIDYYIDPIPGGQVFNVKLSNHVGGAGETSAIQYTEVPASAGAWVSLDLDLSSFVAASDPANLDRSAIAQIVITAARTDTSVPVDIYFDNVYFHKNTTLSTDSFELTEVKVFPNPSSDAWQIIAGSKINTIAIYNITGVQVQSLEINHTRAKIETTKLSTGIYLAKIKTDRGEKVVKLIKK